MLDIYRPRRARRMLKKELGSPDLSQKDNMSTAHGIRQVKAVAGYSPVQNAPQKD